MLTKKEIISFIIVTVLFAFVISFSSILKSGAGFFYSALLIAFIILALNLLIKKLVAYYYECEIEQGIWFFQRYGLYSKSYFKNKIPLGLLLPFFLIILSLGSFKCLTMTEFDISAARARAAKRHGLYRFSELTEFHIAVVAASGIFLNLIAAAIGYLFGFPDFVRYSVYFTIWNMLPISNLDGTKIFFGSRALWITLAFICIIFLLYALLLI